MEYNKSHAGGPKEDHPSSSDEPQRNCLSSPDVSQEKWTSLRFDASFSGDEGERSTHTGKLLSEGPTNLTGESPLQPDRRGATHTG